MKKILITGGSGFIGSFITRKFVSKKFKVLNVDKLSPVSQKLILKDKNYIFKNCNILNYSKLKKIVENFSPNIIIHCAAESHVDRSINFPEFFFQNNLLGTINILDIIKTSKKNIRLIHISTDEVFGSLKLNKKKFDSNSKYDPRSPYAASKASSDFAVRSYGETFGINYSITNCSNNYGPYQFPEKLIPVIIKSCILRIPIPIYGKGKNIRDWMHVNDHANAIYKITLNGNNKETYLIGANNEISNLKLAKTICDLFDKMYSFNESRKLIKFVEDRKGHDFRYSIDFSKTKNQVKWKPEILFLEGLKQTIQFYYQNLRYLSKIFPYNK
jgi:dTDP-glucose 4,6-dehydratase